MCTGSTPSMALEVIRMWRRRIIGAAEQSKNQEDHVKLFNIVDFIGNGNDPSIVVGDKRLIIIAGGGSKNCTRNQLRENVDNDVREHTQRNKIKEIN